MEDIPECLFVPLTVSVVLAVRSLHPQLHVVKKFIFPLTVTRIALFTHESSQNYDIALLLNFFCRLFFLRQYCLLCGDGILLHPPLDLDIRTTSVIVVAVLIIFCNLCVQVWGFGKFWRINSLQVLVHPESLKHREWVKAADCVLRNINFRWQANLSECGLVNTF